MLTENVSLPGVQERKCDSVNSVNPWRGGAESKRCELFGDQRCSVPQVISLGKTVPLALPLWPLIASLT